MLRVGALSGTLNVAPAQRLSVVLCYLICFSTCIAIYWPAVWIMVAVLALWVTGVNQHFYLYIAARRGVWFALRAIPLHWLYFLYCGVCVIVGGMLHVLPDQRPRLYLPRQ